MEENIQDESEKIKKKINWDSLLLELIAVFLGVTSGFFLNNWQAEKQERELEQKYINAFLQDINENISELESSIKDDSTWEKSAKPILLSIKDGTFNEDSAIVVMKLITQISKINARSVTYIDITNSGKLNIIGDFNLKGRIVDYYAEVEGVRFLEQYFYNYFNDLTMPFIFSEYNILTGELSNPGVLKSIRFTNAFSGYFSMIQQRVAAYNALLIKAYLLRDELKNSIEEE